MKDEHGVTLCPRCGYKISTLTKGKASKIRESYPRSFLPWTPAEDHDLEVLVMKNTSILNMTGALGRQPNAIRRRIELLGLKEAQLEAKSQDLMKYMEKTGN